MPLSFRSLATAGLLCALLTGCLFPGRLPLSYRKLRKQPYQAVEVILKDQGPQDPEPLASRLGVPAYDGVSPMASLLRISLIGNAPPGVPASRPKALLIGSGAGLVLGVATVYLFSFTAWPSASAVAAGAGAGLVFGLGATLYEYPRDQALAARLGYRPWHFRGDLTVAVKGEGGGYGLPTVDGPLPNVDARPFLRPLPPEQRTEADIRKESVRAYLEALGERLAKKGVPGPRS
jgi:hypothetical protein